MTAGPPFISLRNVRKVYRSGDEDFLAVSDVTMDVQEGELVSLVGPSGCGKTTVLKILAGLHDADHSFHVPARTGRKDGEVRKQVVDALVGWIDGILAG